MVVLTTTGFNMRFTEAEVVGEGVLEVGDRGVLREVAIATWVLAVSRRNVVPARPLIMWSVFARLGSAKHAGTEAMTSLAKTVPTTKYD